jgi:hypothetical protein
MTGTLVTPRGGTAAPLVAVWIARGSTFVAMLPPLTMSGVRALAAAGQKIPPGQPGCCCSQCRTG